MVQQHLLRKTVIGGKGISWFEWCNWNECDDFIFSWLWILNKTARTTRFTCIHIHTHTQNFNQQCKNLFFPQVIKRGYVKMYNYQFKADPCLCWFHQGHSSGYLICIQTTVFSYLEDSSQWTTTWPEVYDVHTDTELISPCSLSFILSLLSTTRRPSSWISSLLWEPRQL